jgi:hypothetical protein
MKSSAFTVTTTATQIVAPDNQNRTIYVHVTGNGTVYLGGSDVTSTDGLATEKHTTPFEMFLPINQSLYAVVAADTENIRVLIPDAD